MNCPLCHSDTKFAFEAKGFNLLDCVSCSHRFAEIEADEMHVKRIYDDSYFAGDGAGYSDYLIESELLRERGRMYAKKIEKYSGIKGSVLDVGAAAGFILQGFIDEGWSGLGLEPNARIAKVGNDELNMDIRNGSLESFPTDKKFDLVSMIQVAAHFYHPRKAFETSATLLTENGLLLIETWNRESLFARLFGRNWHEYSPPSVLHYFSLDGLTAFLEDLNFEKISHGRPSKKISGEHAKSLLEYRLGKNRIFKLIPKKTNFPYPSEDLFWALYRNKNERKR